MMPSRRSIVLCLSALCLLLKESSGKTMCSVTRELECGENGCDCTGRDKHAACYRVEDINCEHGVCSKSGCECTHCWTGQNCMTLVNSHAPEFSQSFYEVVIPENEATTIDVVKAVDHDSMECKRSHPDTPCPCAEMHYSISNGNDFHLFRINSRTGDVQFVPENHILRLDTLLKISVTNDEFEFQSSETTLLVRFESPAGANANYGFDEEMNSVVGRNLLSVDEEIHSRSKRSAPLDASGTPTNMTFLLKRTNGDEGKTDCMVGDRISFNLSIWVPKVVTTLKVELYTDTNTTAIMSICSPRVSQMGSNFGDLDPAGLIPEKHSTTEDWKYDRVVFDFGTVNNSAANSGEDHMIVIEFDTIVENNPFFTDGENYWVSAGAEYFDKTKVWVTQTSFLATVDNFVSSTPPEFNITGPNELMKGAVGTWLLEMTFYSGATDVILDVYAQLNDTDVMSICRVGVLEGGEGMGCYGDDTGTLTYPILNGTNSSADNIATFDLGSLVNTLYRDEAGMPNAAGSTIVLEINVLLKNTSDAIVDGDYWLGVSVEVDGESIWAVQLTVTAQDQDIATMAEIPSMSLSAVHQQVEVGAAATFLLNMTLPASTTAQYFLEVSLPFNTTAVMTGCDVNIRHVGHNFPCYESALTPEFQSENDDGLFDYIRADLGVITNTGAKNDTASSTISIEICAKLLEHSKYNDGDSVPVTAGVRYSSNMVWIGQTNFIYKNEGQQPQPSAVPTLSVKNIMNSRNKEFMYEGGQTGYFVDLVVPAGNIYPFIGISVQAPILDGAAVFEVCRIRIVHVGKHFACWDSMHQNQSSSELTSSLEDGVMDQASLNLTMVSNGGWGEYWWNKNDSVIRAEVVIRVRKHDSITNDTYTTNFRVNYGGSDDLTESMELMYNTTKPELGEADDLPEYSLKQVTNSSTARIGGAVVFNMDMALTPRTVTSYLVDAIAANNSYLSVCRLAVISRGDNIPCLSEQTGTQYLTYDNDTRYDRATIDLLNVANIGQYARNASNLSNNTLTLEIVMMVHENSSASLDDGDGIEMATSVSQGASMTWQAVLPITIDGAPYNKSDMEMPKFVLSKKNSESSITKGASALFIIELYIPPGSMGGYDLEVYAPFNDTDLGKMSICDIRVISAGWNVPCLNDTHLPRYTSTEDANFTRSEAKLMLGTIVNSAESGDLIHPDNKVTIEVSVLLPYNSTATDGDTLEMSASARINNDKLWVAQHPFTVSGVLLAGESGATPTATRADPLGVTWLYVGGVVRESIKVSIPEMTTDLIVTFTPPTGGGALHRTVSNVHYSFRGENVACACDFDWPLSTTYTSSFGTSHYDNIMTSTGFITNVGTTKRYQWGTYEPDDDVLTVSFDIQATDELANANGTSASVYVDINYGSGGAENFVFTTGVIADQPGEPDMQLFLFTDEFDERSYMDINQGDVVSVKVHANHTWNSTAYASGVSIQLLLPEHLTYDCIHQYTFQDPSVSYDHTKNTLTLMYPKMMFTDNETILVNFTVDPTKLFPIGTRNLSVTILGDIHYDISYKTDIVSLELDAYVPECEDTLGMEDGRIGDCQIKASSSYRDFTPEQVRLNSQGSWANAHRGNPFLYNEFIQINLGNRTRVSGISIQGHNGSADLPDSDISTFMLQYSLEGVLFFNYKENESVSYTVFSVSYNETVRNRSEAVFVGLTGKAIEARAVRIIPLSNDGQSFITGLRLELHGCALSSDTSLSDVCLTDSRFAAYNRGYLVNQDDGTLYVCMVSNIRDSVPACSYTTDEGNTWTQINDVINIDFLRTDTRALYGLGHNRKSRKRSDDGGENWCTISEQEYNTALSDVSEILHVKQLPFEQWQNMGADNLYSTYGFNVNDTVKYSANVTGVHVWTSTTGDWSLVGYWGIDAWE